jgi:hypothetical protein
MSTKFLQNDAFTAMLQKHQRLAVNTLIKGDLSGIDPVIGDASCEMRPPFLLEALNLVRTAIGSSNRDKALALVDAYEAAHEGDKPDTKAKTVADVTGKADPTEYDVMFNAVAKGLGAKRLRYLGLCHTLSVSCIWTREEFASPFYFRSTGTYQTTTPVAEERNDAKARVNREPALRVELAKLAMRHFVDMAHALPHTDSRRAPVGKGPTERYWVEDQLVEAAHFMTSCIRTPDGDLPLLAIYPQFRILLAHLFHSNIPIVVSVRRIELHTTRPGTERDPLEIAEIHDPADTLTFHYALRDARALFFVPNKATGHYQYLAKPSADDAAMPCLAIEAWSTYHADSQGSGLDSADHNEYFRALAKADLAWLVATYAAGHPAFAGNASDRTPVTAPVYGQVCMQLDQTFKCTRERCEGFNLNTHVSGDARPSLHREWLLATQMALARGLTKCQFVSQVGGRYERITRAVDFQIDHVKIMTLAQSAALCHQLRARHAGATKADIGRYIIRIGSVGASCISVDDADELLNINERKRKAEYLKKYSFNNGIVL